MESVFFCVVCKFIIDGLHLFLLDGAPLDICGEIKKKKKTIKQTKMEPFLWKKVCKKEYQLLKLFMFLFSIMSCQCRYEVGA